MQAFFGLGGEHFDMPQMGEIMAGFLDHMFLPRNFGQVAEAALLKSSRF
jgi:hypothetical protein